MPYIIIFALALAVMWLQSNGYEKKIGNHSLWVILYFGILFIFFAIRDNIGFDYPAYCKFIETEYYRLYIYDRWEYLSYFLMDIAHTFANPQIFFIGIAGIALPLYYAAFQRYSRTPQEIMISVLVFFALPIGFLYSLALSRQFVALGILLYATKYMLRREFLKYAICAVVASCFHAYSLVAILFYYVASSRVKIKQCIVMGILLTMAVYFGGPVLEVVFPVFAKYLTGRLNNVGGMTQIGMYGLIGVAILYLYSYINIEKDKYEAWLKCYLLGLSMCFVFVPISPNIGIRCGMPGLMYVYLCAPRMLSIVSRFKYANLLRICFVLLTFSLYMYGLCITEEGIYIPYKYKLLWN